MAVVNPLSREVVLKVVYYGPGLGGKTSSLQHVHAHTRPEHRGKMVSLATPVDRTLYFDYLPIRIPAVRGLGVRLQLFTVPGQVYYNATRKLVLTGADAVVFVADSQRVRLESNLESLDNLRENLREHGRELGEMPHVLQYNKRDLPETVSLEELDRELNAHGAVSLGTVATKGEGVFEALQAVTEAMLREFERRAPAEAPAEQRELMLPEGGLAEALRLADGETGPRNPTPAPPPVRGASGAHALGLPLRAPGELAARALADGESMDTDVQEATPFALVSAPQRPEPISPELPSPELPSPASPHARPQLAGVDAPPPTGRPAPPETRPAGAAAGQVPSPAVFGFHGLWSPAERPLAASVEAAIAAGDYGVALLGVDHLVTRALAAIAGQLGAGGDAPRDPAVVVLLLGLDGRRYLGFRGLVRDVRGGRQIEEQEVLRAYAFAIEIRIARSL
ncbi:MAG: GTPase domain-containing protein [Polyangiaceae bacterium]|nr:GTPase domain-containing protein [Polyangiaceae bacterium]